MENEARNYRQNSTNALIMLAIISCNAQLLSVHSFIFIVIVSCLFPFVTTYFGFSPFFVGFCVFFFHNDSFSSFSLNFVSINSIFWFLATFSFPPHLSHFCVSIACIIKAFVELCREFLALFSILSLAFSPCLFYNIFTESVSICMHRGHSS